MQTIAITVGLILTHFGVGYFCFFWGRITVVRELRVTLEFLNQIALTRQKQNDLAGEANE